MRYLASLARAEENLHFSLPQYPNRVGPYTRSSHREPDRTFARQVAARLVRSIWSEREWVSAPRGGTLRMAAQVALWPRVIIMWIPLQYYGCLQEYGRTP